MTQYYILEIKKVNDEYQHDVSWAFDEDPKKALLKGESAYYAKLSSASISDYAIHSVTLIADNGTPVMWKFYNHAEEEPVE